MNRRRFTPEFKDEAVRLVLKEGVSQTQAASELGIGLSTLHKWLKEHRNRQETNGGEVMSESDVAELRRLRKEVHRLKIERDLLKKATAYFARTNE
jgi:transposase